MRSASVGQRQGSAFTSNLRCLKDSPSPADSATLTKPNDPELTAGVALVCARVLQPHKAEADRLDRVRLGADERLLPLAHFRCLQSKKPQSL